MKITRMFLPLLGLIAAAIPVHASAAVPRLESPDGNIAVDIRVADRLTYDVLYKEVPLLANASLSLRIDGATLGRAPKLKSATPGAHDAVLTPAVQQKAAKLRENYHELRLEFAGGYAVTFRAYNEGVAYRWETMLPAAKVKVYAEEVAYRFTANHVAWFPEELGFMSHNERAYLPRALGDLATQNLASLPVVVEARSVKIAFAESDLEDYPGLWFTGTGGNALAGTFPPVALEEQLSRDRDLKVTVAADYIALTKGTRTYPWRILEIAPTDADLLTNQLVWLLASPSRIADTSWIKPGKVAWDWWNANNLTGVDFKTGINTATYKYYIDFAAKNGLQYVILDEGWYRLGNVLDVNPDIDLPALIAYGRERHVGIILWVVWKTLDNQFTAALDQFEKWGVSGIKVDFMQRSDQAIIEFYHRTSREAARRHLLVDYHGANQPALMTRTWPNILSTEGVRGLEWNKWSVHTTPKHDVTLPFTRQLLGPMDYTPGAMHNANRVDFSPVFSRPSSQGTRCHQLALYVVFESPLQMLADTPSNYQREPEAMEFLRAVPSVWDETHVIDARIGDYVLTARRTGRDWFIGAITDWNSREFDVDLSFLPAGEYQLTEWRDGVNADRQAEDFRQATHVVNNTMKFHIRLAAGGGWAAKITAK